MKLSDDCEAIVCNTIVPTLSGGYSIIFYQQLP